MVEFLFIRKKENQTSSILINNPFHYFHFVKEFGRVLFTYRYLSTPYMIEPLRYVGRVGKLKDSVASGSYVKVDSYDPEVSEYRVKMLSDPEEETHRVKLTDIEFQTAPEFVDVFSNPPHFIIQEKLDMKNIPFGSVIDFTECTSDPIVDSEKLVVRGSYRFLGKRIQSENCMDVLTCLPYGVYIGAQDESDIIEFENIAFEGNDCSYNVVCLRGNIVFRGCSFGGMPDGIKVGSGNTPVKVLLENSTISYAGNCGVVVDAKTQLSMRNVDISGPGVSVSVKGGGVLDAHHCTYAGNLFGLVMSGEGSRTEVTHCVFTYNKRCGVLVDGGSLTMAHCEVSSSAGCGIIIVDQIGQVNAAATIDYCSIIYSGCGIRISGTGTCKSSNVSVVDCTVGVYLTSTSTGEVALCESKYLNNIVDMVNLSVESNRLSIDSVSEPVVDILQRLQKVHTKIVSLPDKVSELSSALSTVWSLKVKRFMARLNMHTPLPEGLHHIRVRTCHHCDKLETSKAGASFRKCGDCMQVCYCSKDCQRMHWAQHKIECNLLNDWYRELWRLEYVYCMFCHEVMRKDSEQMVFTNRFVYCLSCSVHREDEVNTLYHYGA